jgi:hypothetical protein
MTHDRDTSGTDTPRSGSSGSPGLIWAGVAGLAVLAVIGYLLLTGTGPWSDDSSPTPGTPTPSATATSSATDAATFTDEATTTAPPATSTDSPTAGGETVEPCGALTGTVDTAGVPDATAATAERLMAAALACDGAELVRMATADQTELSFGIITPEEAFAIPAASEEENRYRLLSTLLTFAPRVDDEFGFHRWPAEPETDADWQALVDAGVISASVRDTMREFGEGYIGYRVVIAADGRWTAFLSGD